MTAIGELLRATRERKGLSFDRVADETNIAKRYLAALEAEDFSVFPGDPYVIGFLRNYAEYLGLPSDELANSYKNMKIQEQPVPIQDLIPKRGPTPLAIGASIGGAVVVVAIVLVAVLTQRKPAGEEMATSRRNPTEYRVDGSTFERRVYKDDSILVAYGAEKYKLLVERIDDAVTLVTPVGATRLMLGEEATLDLDGNSSPELKLLVSDLSKKDASKGAVLKLEYASLAAAQAAQAASLANGAQPGSSPAEASSAAAASSAVAASSAAAAAAQQAAAQPAAPIAQAAPAAQPAPAALSTASGGKPVVLFESSKTTYPFVVSVTFRASCMFRYEVDKRDRDERYYRKGDIVTVNAQNSLRLWASNAQAAKLTVQASGGKSADLDLGGPGEIAVKRIAWTQGDSGTWILGAAEVD